MAARFPKPWFRPFRGIWYVTLDGRQIGLGPNRDEAFKQYHGLMAAGRPKPVSCDSVVALVDAYLEWRRVKRIARARRTSGTPIVCSDSPRPSRPIFGRFSSVRFTFSNASTRWTGLDRTRSGTICARSNVPCVGRSSRATTSVRRSRPMLFACFNFTCSTPTPATGTCSGQFLICHASGTCRTLSPAAAVPLCGTYG